MLCKYVLCDTYQMVFKIDFCFSFLRCFVWFCFIWQKNVLVNLGRRFNWDEAVDNWSSKLHILWKRVKVTMWIYATRCIMQFCEQELFLRKKIYIYKKRRKISLFKKQEWLRVFRNYTRVFTSGNWCFFILAIDTQINISVCISFH